MFFTRASHDHGGGTAYGNKISSAGLKSLSRAIIKIPLFDMLCITDNPEITTEGIKDFLSSMINHPNLREVTVYEKHAIQAKDHIKYVNQERKKRGLKNIVVSTKYGIHQQIII